MAICANSCSGVTCKNAIVGFLKIAMSSTATLVIKRSFRASYISRIILLIFAFLSHADCCAVVAAAVSGINSARIGLAAIVTILGRSSGCSVVTVFPGSCAHAESDNMKPSNPSAVSVACLTVRLYKRTAPVEEILPRITVQVDRSRSLHC